MGAAGFAVGGAGLVGDVVEQPIVAAEIAGVVAVAAWWLTAGRALRSGPASALGTFSLLLAALALVALALQSPWGLWLGAALRRHPRPFGAA